MDISALVTILSQNTSEQQRSEAAYNIAVAIKSGIIHGEKHLDDLIKDKSIENKADLPLSPTKNHVIDTSRKINTYKNVIVNSYVGHFLYLTVSGHRLLSSYTWAIAEACNGLRNVIALIDEKNREQCMNALMLLSYICMDERLALKIFEEDPAVLAHIISYLKIDDLHIKLRAATVLMCLASHQSSHHRLLSENVITHLNECISDLVFPSISLSSSSSSSRLIERKIKDVEEWIPVLKEGTYQDQLEIYQFRLKGVAIITFLFLAMGSKGSGDILKCAGGIHSINLKETISNSVSSKEEKTNKKKKKNNKTQKKIQTLQVEGKRVPRELVFDALSLHFGFATLKNFTMAPDADQQIFLLMCINFLKWCIYLDPSFRLGLLSTQRDTLFIASQLLIRNSYDISLIYSLKHLNAVIVSSTNFTTDNIPGFSQITSKIPSVRYCSYLQCSQLINLNSSSNLSPLPCSSLPKSINVYYACNECSQTVYCSKTCSVSHYSQHKLVCRRHHFTFISHSKS